MTIKQWMTMLVCSLMFTLPAFAKADKYTVELEMKDGDLSPLVLEIPKKTKIRIEVKNTGTQPAEFESTQLRKEKVLAPGAKSVVVIAPLKPGEYEFFDDFHLDHPRGKIVVKE